VKRRRLYHNLDFTPVFRAKELADIPHNSTTISTITRQNKSRIGESRNTMFMVKVRQMRESTSPRTSFINIEGAGMNPKLACLFPS
jgi:hypothetical protein